MRCVWWVNEGLFSVSLLIFFTTGGAFHFIPIHCDSTGNIVLMGIVMWLRDYLFTTHIHCFVFVLFLVFLWFHIFLHISHITFRISPSVYHLPSGK